MLCWRVRILFPKWRMGISTVLLLKQFAAVFDQSFQVFTLLYGSSVKVRLRVTWEHLQNCVLFTNYQKHRSSWNSLAIVSFCYYQHKICALHSMLHNGGFKRSRSCRYRCSKWLWCAVWNNKLFRSSPLLSMHVEWVWFLDGGTIVGGCHGDHNDLAWRLVGGCSNDSWRGISFCCNITGKRGGQGRRVVVFNHRHSHCCCNYRGCWSWCCGDPVDSGVVSSGTILKCPSLSLSGKSFFFASNQDMNAVIQIVKETARCVTTHISTDAEWEWRMESATMEWNALRTLLAFDNLFVGVVLLWACHTDYTKGIVLWVGTKVSQVSSQVF